MYIQLWDIYKEMSPWSDTCRGGVWIGSKSSGKMKVNTTLIQKRLLFYAEEFFRERTSKTWAVEWHFHWAVSALSPAHANTICRGGGTAVNWNSSPGSFGKLGSTSHGPVTKAWRDCGHPRTSRLTVIQTQKQTNRPKILPNSGEISHGLLIRNETSKS